MSWAVRFEGVTKRYRATSLRYRSLRHDLSQGVRALGLVFSRKAVRPQGKLALDNVSFEVEQGESFGIIGPNGAGKTTALRILSRITYPTGGQVRVRGRVGALIEVGSGVHPELTGRENIWLYGQILGMKRGDIRRRFDDVVAFAELGDVLDMPVKQYSSGMQLRLGFAVASHMEPDVFVVDEALAVGDAAFQARCAIRMKQLVREGRTILFVSHNLPAVRETCQRGILMVDGRIHSLMPIDDLMDSYLEMVNSQQLAWQKAASPSDGAVIELRSASCRGPDGRVRYAIKTGDDLEIRLACRAVRKVVHPSVTIGITDGRGGMLIVCSTILDGGAPEVFDGDFIVRCILGHVPLLPRHYQVWCAIHADRPPGDVLNWGPVSHFQVSESPGPGLSESPSLSEGAVYVARSWDIRSSPSDTNEQ